MRVRLTAARAGDGFVEEVGQVVDVSHAEAQRLVASGQAEVLDQSPAPGGPKPPSPPSTKNPKRS